jgi:hypothetical protein
MDVIRGLADTSFEIDKRDYLAHPVQLGYLAVLKQTDLSPRDEQKIWSGVKWLECKPGPHLISHTSRATGRSRGSAT